MKILSKVQIGGLNGEYRYGIKKLKTFRVSEKVFMNLYVCEPLCMIYDRLFVDFHFASLWEKRVEGYFMLWNVFFWFLHLTLQ